MHACTLSGGLAPADTIVANAADAACTPPQSPLSLVSWLNLKTGGDGMNAGFECGLGLWTWARVMGGSRRSTSGEKPRRRLWLGLGYHLGLGLGQG